jgi:hypothetical protein
MHVRLKSALALPCLGLAVFAAVVGAHAQQAPRIALKSGESVELRGFYNVVNCQSIIVGTPALDVLEGDEDLTVSLKQSMRLPIAEHCAKQVPGGVVVATAKDVTEKKEVKLTFRIKMNTKLGDRQFSNTYRVSLFP